jgi:hypothetical protein
MVLANVTHLVFAGGGVRGISYVGALQALRDVTGLDFGSGTRLRVACGVSVGSLFALLVACGYTVSEITQVATYALGESLIVANPAALLTDEFKALDDGQKLTALVSSILARKGFNDLSTLEDVKAKTGVELHTVVTDLTNASVVYVTPDTHPTLPVITALRATMALPLLLPPVLSPEGHIWIDGGLMDNYPITRYPPNCTLGFMFKWHMQPMEEGILAHLMRVISVSQIPSEVFAWRSVPQCCKERTIMIDTGRVGIADGLTSSITSELRTQLLRCGADSVRQALELFTECQSFNNSSGDLDAGDQLGTRELPHFMTPPRNNNYEM